jgi:hypothetical protein
MLKMPVIEEQRHISLLGLETKPRLLVVVLKLKKWDLYRIKRSL